MADETNTAPTGLPDRVLVVEDDALLGMSIEEALRDAGIADVELCTTTDDALAAMRRLAPGAIVLDVHLADRDDGWAIAEMVRALGPHHPAIVFSTGSPDDIPENIAEYGTVLAKPYDPDALVAALREPPRLGLLARLRGALRPE